MKRHKPKTSDWRAPCICKDCAARTIRVVDGVFVAYCTTDGTVVDGPPVYCKNRVDGGGAK